MSNTTHTPNLDNLDYTTKDMLQEADLDAVTGGFGDIKGESIDKGHKDWPSSIRSI
jgi:hypothetical protein